ncbi:NAD(P)-dependent oxidoreductase [Actinomadura sp. KC216]|uniref:NAD(P)-dependent oxidoreductase n=1 Tax=Actinomadura sp. KC216 TaxID=2530370 RepID=UPI00104F2F40|nr:NAD(P)-binding domain-containing protein [Actinomadura sp. KC216]TDB83446.1 NAD(P)-dependent oxidoreductase [Actinomadura sp. KC216]
MTETSETNDTRPAVTMIGLGEMGTALATAFLDGGHPTTVWNRTPGKADALVSKGAHLAETVRDAVAASPLLVVNLKGNTAAREVLASAGDALAGKAVVNLTDGTSAEVTAVAEWTAGQGAHYLHGQIMTIAPGIGHPDAVVFYGGDKTVYDRFQSTLQLLSGRASLIADDPRAPVLYGMAVHGTMWGTLNGFLHAAALLRNEGIEVSRFLEDATPSVSALLSFLPSIADTVDRGDHAVEYGALKHHLPSIEDLFHESQARGVDAELPAYTLALVARAIDQGHANDNYSRLIDHYTNP